MGRELDLLLDIITDIPLLQTYSRAIASTIAIFFVS